MGERNLSVYPATSVVRVLAPNPGLFTGPGTNTYVVISAGECVVIDPGPDNDLHRTAICDAIGKLRPRAVLVTHTHSDHAPLANPIAAEFGVRSYGGAAGPGFDPDRRLRDGDRLVFGRAVLEVLHTPGHTDDHLCFRLGNTLFTGDHIMGGSTVVVEDMISYLRSLHRVAETRPARLLPGHGHEIDDPAGVIAGYLDHRVAREAQILDTVRSGAATVGQIVESVYGELDSRLHPAAAISVIAHLKKLDHEGRLIFDPRTSPGADNPSNAWNLVVGSAPGAG